MSDVAEARHVTGKVTSGSRLVDQTGSVVPELVVKDKLLLQDDGFLVVMVSIDRRTGRLLSSPDIITHGSFSIRDNAQLMESLRLEIRKVLRTQKITHATLDQVKNRMKTVIGQYLSNKTNGVPIIIPVLALTSDSAS